MNILSATSSQRKVLFGFHGTISRMEYWWYFITPYSLLFSFLMLFNVGSIDDSLWNYLSFPFGFLYIWSSFAVSIKRIRDSGVEFKWLWFSLVPVVGQIWLFYCILFKESTSNNQSYGGSHESFIRFILKISGCTLRGVKSVLIPIGFIALFLIFSLFFFFVELPVAEVCQETFRNLYFGYGRADCNWELAIGPKIASNVLYAMLSCVVLPVVFAHIYRIESSAIRLFVTCALGVFISSQVFTLLGVIGNHQAEMLNLVHLFSVACVVHVLLVTFRGRSLVSYIALYIIALSIFHLSDALLIYTQEYNKIDVPEYYKDLKFNISFFLFQSKDFVLPINGMVLGSVLWWSYALSKKKLGMSVNPFKRTTQRLTVK